MPGKPGIVVARTKILANCHGQKGDLLRDMLFNSYQFLIFFLMTAALFYAVKHRFRWPLLLVLSCYFYMVFVPKYIVILFFLIAVDYIAGLLIESARGRKRK